MRQSSKLLQRFLSFISTHVNLAIHTLIKKMKTKLGFSVFLSFAIKNGASLDSAGDFNDDSFSWQWNYKNEIARIVDQIVQNGYVSKSDGTELISSTKLNKYVDDLGDYMDFKLKFPIPADLKALFV